MKKRVAILISGSGSNMVALVKAMQNGQVSATPALVLADKKTAVGLAKARALGVPTQLLEHSSFPNHQLFEKALDQILRHYQVDITCLAGFMRILTPNFIQKWPGSVLNIHPSLLPHFPGLNTHQRAIDAGHSHSGCSVHLVTELLDKGPVLSQNRTRILPDDTAASLAARILIAEHQLYPATLQQFMLSAEQN